MLRILLLASLLCGAAPAFAEVLQPQTTGKDDRAPKSALGSGTYSSNFRPLRMAPVQGRSAFPAHERAESAPRSITSLPPLNPAERHVAHIPLRPAGEPHEPLRPIGRRPTHNESHAVVPTSPESGAATPAPAMADTPNRVTPAPVNAGRMTPARPAGLAPGASPPPVAGQRSPIDTKSMITQMLMNGMIGGGAGGIGLPQGLGQ